MERLTTLYNEVFKIAKMSKEWKWITMILLYKNKGNIHSCNNYRIINLLSHTLKVWERVVELRVRRGVSISDIHLDACHDESTINCRNHPSC